MSSVERCGILAALKATKLPLLHIGGDHDIIFPVENWYALNGSTWRPLDGLGHFRLLDDAPLLDEIRRFATRVNSA